MDSIKVTTYLKEVIKNMPTDWLELTTHRLDIYDEKLAKTQFLDQFESLFQQNEFSTEALSALPTAYDYIRLGHPLSCVLEWAIAKTSGIQSENVISFSSQTTPLLAVLRKNHLENRATQLLFRSELPQDFDAEVVRNVYGYNFELKHLGEGEEILPFEGSTILISQQTEFAAADLSTPADFFINLHPYLGSILVVNGQENEAYISEIQHVRRRETIAMTPSNCLIALKILTDQEASTAQVNSQKENKASVLKSILSITGTKASPLVASSGLSMQYAIMMGLVHDAQENHPGKAIKFIVPPNCYGGTNDQARRVAACDELVEVVDLPVDGDNEMVRSIDTILDQLALEDAIPYIIAEIPTNPRVEVPDLQKLRAALSKERITSQGRSAIAPVFILDQTFCPNVLFLGDGEVLSTVKSISYASGSKFPSGGKCIAGYCVANEKAAELMSKIELHLNLCDNEATSLQYEILAKQLPSMNQRIKDAYSNTREFVNFIHDALPEAKINFVSEELAEQGFTPSVFSLDLPTKGGTDAEKEAYKRALNLKLIQMMITEIPDESKYCVSYGQLKGCYWTIPATSTQGTTKEGDKDYIIRASLAPTLDLEKHKQVFSQFVNEL